MNKAGANPSLVTTPTVVVAPALVVEQKPVPILTPEQQAVVSETTNPASDAPARATKTREQEREALGQRRINLIWEGTQSIIALVVTGSVVYSALNAVQSEILGNAFTLIIAIYFVRMNHTKIGGVKPGDDGR